MLMNTFKIPIALLLITVLNGCSATSFNDLFSSYAQQMQQVNIAQRQGNFKYAINVIPPRSESDGTFNLRLLEQARLNFLDRDYAQSQVTFNDAYNLIQQQQQAAKIELSRGVENVGAILSNDNATRYDIPYYEQSMLHSYQALNYLYQQDLSGALVEIRRANLVQQSALHANQDSLQSSRQSMVRQSNMSKQYPTMETTIGQVKNGFQNAFTFYLSALLYQSAGELNDAYIDYKKALEIYPNNIYLQRDVWRLANKLFMIDDVKQFKKRFSATVTQESIPKNSGEVVVIVEQGIISPKQESSIHLPIFTRHNDMRFYSVALPTYQNNLTTYQPVQVRVQDEIFLSQEIVRLQSLAAKQLKDQYPLMVTRQIARVVAKEELRQQMSKQGGDIGNILASLYNISSEKADTRSWSTLPNSIHILRIPITAGEHTLSFNINGTTQNINVAITKEKQTLIKISAIGSYTDHQIHHF
ncbi:hypothetical protein GCM10009111_32150 [Colwellia asteriadis]|uniref:Uncharacterized protein n=2 Tax=Colwellia asteriadis TaxID=517723 RepID=A0ABN1LB90_9GAMM